MLSTFIAVMGFFLSYLPRLQHPLSLMAVVFILSLGSCLALGMTVSSWYGYILFLIYVGALLVMFTYSTALASNPLFVSEKMIWGVLGGMLIFLGYSTYGIESRSGYSMDCNVVESSFKAEETLIGLVMIGLILFIAMMAVVKVCSTSEGPLRS
uniref:NADH dehydrogenase subunit 6 n=1 Tax=Laternula truncata TaxID=1199070 RepID=A0A1U9XPL5_9BIVA|nr:NADH dehydrogenase subunit 6 [Laternula truncata]AQZ26192.1 NADH dehydrogenase subunit 6 [Laternula truncata]